MSKSLHDADVYPLPVFKRRKRVYLAQRLRDQQCWQPDGKEDLSLTNSKHPTYLSNHVRVPNTDYIPLQFHIITQRAVTHANNTRKVCISEAFRVFSYQSSAFILKSVKSLFQRHLVPDQIVIARPINSLRKAINSNRLLVHNQ